MEAKKNLKRSNREIRLNIVLSIFDDRKLFLLSMLLYVIILYYS